MKWKRARSTEGAPPGSLRSVARTSWSEVLNVETMNLSGSRRTAVSGVDGKGGDFRSQDEDVKYLVLIRNFCFLFEIHLQWYEQ